MKIKGTPAMKRECQLSAIIYVSVEYAGCGQQYT
jgi:hypothetical protein